MEDSSLILSLIASYKCGLVVDAIRLPHNRAQYVQSLVIVDTNLSGDTTL